MQKGDGEETDQDAALFPVLWCHDSQQKHSWFSDKQRLAPDSIPIIPGRYGAEALSLPPRMLWRGVIQIPARVPQNLGVEASSFIQRVYIRTQLNEGNTYELMDVRTHFSACFAFLAWIIQLN